MTDLIRPDELPRWVPGKVLLASDDKNWGNLVLRSYRYDPQDVLVPAMRDFMLVAYRRGPTPMDRKVEGPWSREFIVPGNVSLLTRAEESHWHWTGDIEVTHLYLTRELLAKVSAEMFDRDIADVRLQDVLKTDDPVLLGGIAAVAEEVRTNSTGGKLFVDSVVTQICIQILRRYAVVEFREARISGGLSPLQAKMVTDFIELHLEQPLSLDDLAKVVNVSASHFLRQFKLRFGCAPHHYVVQRRLARAQQLLERTSLALKEVSANSGFADQSHMTRLFQRYLNTTPSAYRASVRS